MKYILITLISLFPLSLFAHDVDFDIHFGHRHYWHGDHWRYYHRHYHRHWNGYEWVLVPDYYDED